MKTRKRLLRTLLMLAPLGLVAVPALFRLLRPEAGSSALFSQQLLLLACLYFAFGAGALLRRRSRTATVAILSGAMLLAFNQVQHDPPGASAGLRLAYLRVDNPRGDYRGLLAEAAAVPADFLSIRDSGEMVAARLSADLQKTYPYAYLATDRRDTGIAVLSRYPLAEVGLTDTDGIVQVTGRVMHPEGSVGFLVQGGGDALHADARWEAAANRMRGIEGPRFLVGEWPQGPSAAGAVRFRRMTGLSDSRNDLLEQLAVMTRAPSDSVDYIFHSEDLVCRAFGLLDALRFRGMTGDYRWRPRAES